MNSNCDRRVAELDSTKWDEKIENLVKNIAEKFEKLGHELKKEDIRDLKGRLNLLLKEFSVPESEAVKTIETYLAKKFEIDREELLKIREAPHAKIGELSDPDDWVTLRVKVIQLWESKSESVAQTGLVGDETGVMKFVIWSSAKVPEVEEGKSYVFRNVVTDRYRDRLQINVTRSSSVEEIDEDVKLPPRDVEIRGALVAIRQGSGLIRRCPECRRVVKKGVCPVHGRIKPVEDLRVKGVLDDGENVYEVVLDRNVVAELTGITLEKAREIARETLDTSAPLDEIRRRMVGRYYRFVAFKGERYYVVSEGSVLKPETSEANELLRLAA